MIEYWEQLPPFTELSISIRAYTYWDSSQQVQLILNSPASTPSAPLNLRSFVTYQRQHFDDHKVNITIRWNMPLNPNGHLEGYKIKCWYEEDNKSIESCDNSTVGPDSMEYVASDFLKNQVYFFQVSILVFVFISYVCKILSYKILTCI